MSSLGGTVKVASIGKAGATATPKLGGAEAEHTQGDGTVPGGPEPGLHDSSRVIGSGRPTR
jgi:hypothetical protein